MNNIKYAVNAKVTSEVDFYNGNSPLELIEKYGSPLYVYSEKVLRTRCRDIKSLVKYPNFRVNFSAKANSNLSLLKIAMEEGLDADAMSTGEIFVEYAAGFPADRIFFVPNNVSDEEMKYAIDRNILVSVDSLSQLERYGKLNEGGKVAVRFNPGIGAGHHAKVVTAGDKTKFGVCIDDIDNVKALLKKYSLRLVGINHHVGSLFMDDEAYIHASKVLFDVAKHFDTLEFVDIGGGFGVPYKKMTGQERLDLEKLGSRLDEVIADFVKDYGREIKIKVEPGRYIVAECGVLLGTVYALKTNADTKYVGTDLGFNVIIRPTLYNSHHDIEVYRENGKPSDKIEEVTIVGNICETGDILVKNQELPEIFEGDILGVLDAGAYCYSMASNYNNRLRPAEVLICENGEVKLIRKRDTLEDLLRNYEA